MGVDAPKVAQMPPRAQYAAMISATNHRLVVALLALAALAINPRAAAAAAAPPTQDPSNVSGSVQALEGGGPLDFRCDHMTVIPAPQEKRTQCRGNVVIRRGPMWVCCADFTGLAAENWQWQQVLCQGDVRAARGDELMWSDKATFYVGASDLLLTGRPLLMRGQSAITGSRILVNVQTNRAQVSDSRGRLVREASKAAPKPKNTPQAALPATCPLPPRPTLAPLPDPTRQGTP